MHYHAALWGLCWGLAAAPPVLGETCASVAPYAEPRMDDRGPEAPEICHKGFALRHDNARKVPIWVEYVLTRERVLKCLDRSDHFQPDPALNGAGARLSDYAGTEFHRGHSAASADMQWSKEAEAESFYLSNITPQEGALNSGPWRRLEEVVRAWAFARGQLLVVTGPIFGVPNPARTKTDGVAIPAQYYKVVYDVEANEAISFVVPQTARGGVDFDHWVVTLDVVRQLSGVDPLPGAPGVRELCSQQLWHYDLKAYRTERQRSCEAGR